MNNAKQFFRNKDAVKFAQCNKLIARGAPGSSSQYYADMYDNVNVGEYTSDDVVGISVNGSCPNRVSFDAVEVSKAIAAGASIVKDSSSHTARPYNVGERELQAFLLENGYEKVKDNCTYSVWKPKS